MACLLRAVVQRKETTEITPTDRAEREGQTYMGEGQGKRMTRSHRKKQHLRYTYLLTYLR